jgi:hypothetical protein
MAVHGNRLENLLARVKLIPAVSRRFARNSLRNSESLVVIRLLAGEHGIALCHAQI